MCDKNVHSMMNVTARTFNRSLHFSRERKQTKKNEIASMDHQAIPMTVRDHVNAKNRIY